MLMLRVFHFIVTLFLLVLISINVACSEESEAKGQNPPEKTEDVTKPETNNTTSEEDKDKTNKDERKKLNGASIPK